MRKSLPKALATLVLAMAFACSERGAVDPEPETNPPPEGVNISEAGVPPATSVFNGAASSSVTLGEVAYVSAEPGSIPSGLRVKIRNTSSSIPSVLANVVNGGFDPVAVIALTGDKLDISVITFSGDVISYVVSVPPKRPPIIVRTNPAKGRVDVALTQVVTVVFSEPVNPATVTGASVKLLLGEDAISANVAVAADGLSASLTPAKPLDPATTYVLDVTRQIRDRDGDQLESGQSITFTTVPSATAPTFPAGPSDVKLVFQMVDDGGATHLYTINGDGTDLRQLTPGSDGAPAVSPDGKRIAFSCSGQVCVMNADGSGVNQITTLGGAGPDWSPDGKKIVFHDPLTKGLSTINADGSEAIVPLTTDLLQDTEDGAPSWSPDGSQITFWRWEFQEFSVVWVVNSNGSGARRLGRLQPFDSGIRTWAAWSPVWTKSGRIVFVGPGDGLTSTIWSMNGDGTGVTEIRTFPSQQLVTDVGDASADASRIAFTLNINGRSDIFLLNGGILCRVTNNGRSFAPALLTR